MEIEVKVGLRDYKLLAEALFHYEEQLDKQLLLHHTVKERETIESKLTEVSKLVSRVEDPLQNMSIYVGSKSQK